MSFNFVSPLVSLKRTNDVFSKHILSRKEHKAFLIDLLNAVIFDKGHHPEDEKILDVFLEDRVLSPRHDEDKIGILDIIARTRKRIYTIEIQQYVEKDIGARSYYYAAKVLGSEITRGIPYHKLTPVIIINFLTHNHLRQYEVTSTDVKIVDLPYNLNSYFLKAGITAYIGRSLYGQNNIYRHGCT